MRSFLPVLLFMIAVSPYSFGQTPQPYDVNAAVEQELRALMQTEICCRYAQ
jgi:hypothetical protein